VEVIAEERSFRHLDVEGNWQDLALPPRALAFSLCQTPIIYRLDDAQPATLKVFRKDGGQQELGRMSLSADDSAELFRRSGEIRRIEATFPAAVLFAEPSH